MTKWHEVKLAELATIKYGKNQKDVAIESSNIPIYGTGGIMGYASKALYDKPSVLIGRKGTIDKVRYVTKPFWTVDTTFYTIINENKILPRYFYYLLSLVDLSSYNEGTTIPSLRTETLNRLEFMVPPLDVQKKIAGVLGALDDKIELNNRINNNLEQQAQALFNEKILNNPKHGCIGDYCSIKSGFAFKSAWWQNAGVRVIKIKNIGPSGLNLQECSYVSDDKVSIAKDFVVKGGDLLIAMTGATIGKFAIVPHTDEILLVNQRVGKFFLGNNPLEKLPFIYCTLKQPEVASVIINRGQGSAQPNISGNDIMSITCTYSDENIISDFNNICRPYFEKIIINQYENTRLSALRDTLLPKLMSGEIDVSKVDILNSNLLFRENA